MRDDDENLLDEPQEEAEKAEKQSRRFLDYAKQRKNNAPGGKKQGANKAKTASGGAEGTSQGAGASGGGAGATEGASSTSGSAGAAAGAESGAAAPSIAAAGTSAEAGTIGAAQGGGAALTGGTAGGGAGTSAAGAAGGAAAGGGTAAAGAGGAATLPAWAIAGLILAAYFILVLVIALMTEMNQNIPQIMSDTPSETGFHIDESVGPDGESPTAQDAYFNSITAIQEGIKIAQERCIKQFLEEVDRKGLDKELTLRNSDLRGLLQVSYEPMLINAVYATMKRQKGCTIDEIRELIAENLQFTYSLSDGQEKQETALFEYRGVVYYKGFYAWEWRWAYDHETDEWYRYLVKVYIDNMTTKEYGTATFNPITRDDFYACFGYSDEGMGDEYYAESRYNMATGSEFIDWVLEKVFGLGTRSETPYHASYFDMILDMTETAEKYLFDTVAGNDIDSYYDVTEYMQAYVMPEELAYAASQVDALVSTVNSLTLLELDNDDIYNNVRKDKLKAIGDIPLVVSAEYKEEMQEKAAQCQKIITSWQGAEYISNADRITLWDNLIELRSVALNAKLTSGDRSVILQSTRHTLDILLNTIVMGDEKQYGTLEEIDKKNYSKPSMLSSLNESAHAASPSCDTNGTTGG